MPEPRPAPAAAGAPVDDPAGSLLLGNAAEIVPGLPPESVDLSLFSPPYGVGKAYETGLDRTAAEAVAGDVIRRHRLVLRPGAFLVVNAADLLTDPDPGQGATEAADVRRRTAAVTRQQVLAFLGANPGASTAAVARALGCSPQTVLRRLRGNRARTGARRLPTRVRPAAPPLLAAAAEAGLVLYDRKIWAKGPAWHTSPWHANSYRSVDDFEYLYVFRKPGPLVYDRARLTRQEWSRWGSRGIWDIPAAARTGHPAPFPEDLAVRAIRLYTGPGGHVLDPFAGSGTTAAAAAALGRPWTAIERDSRYLRAIQERIARIVRTRGAAP